MCWGGSRRSHRLSSILHKKLRSTLSRTSLSYRRVSIFHLLDFVAEGEKTVPFSFLMQSQFKKNEEEDEEAEIIHLKKK
jgi:hypothetical protein